MVGCHFNKIEIIMQISRSTDGRYFEPIIEMDEILLKVSLVYFALFGLPASRVCLKEAFLYFF